MTSNFDLTFLSLEQQLRLRIVEDAIQQMNEDDLREQMLRLVYLMMLKDGFIKKLIKDDLDTSLQGWPM